MHPVILALEVVPILLGHWARLGSAESLEFDMQVGRDGLEEQANDLFLASLNAVSFGGIRCGGGGFVLAKIGFSKTTEASSDLNLQGLVSIVALVGEVADA